jgi:DNA-binding SARP family transcriptional activator
MNSVSILRPLILQLLGSFVLMRDNERIELPRTVQRLVVLLALRERPLTRAYIAGVLWPDYSTERSHANLRTALWRANQCRVAVVAASGERLCLYEAVQVDVQALTGIGRVASGRSRSLIKDYDSVPWLDLSLDLLPDWYDEWLVDDREGIRQLRLQVLERLTDEFSLTGRHTEAIQAALATVRIDPLRETAQAALIRAHLAYGNRLEAVRQFHRFRVILDRELALEPSGWLRGLITDEAAPGFQARPAQCRIGPVITGSMCHRAD